jgi:hypothetical protein
MRSAMGELTRDDVAGVGARDAPSVRATIRALAAPRRLLPTLIVCAAVVAAQAGLSRDRLAAPLGLALCLAFVLVAPVSYRVLFARPTRLLHGLVLLALYGTIGAGVVAVLGIAVPSLLHMAPTLLTEKLNLVVCVALFLVGGWGLGRDIVFEEHLRDARTQLSALERQAADAQLLALRAHLDPHFLFNTLNAIAEWCREDGAVAERAVLRLSQMLRAILGGVRAGFWPLGDELELVDTLYELHRLRDPQLFQFRRQVPADLDAIRVPPLILLPLAENAVKHGPGAGHRGEIGLEVSRQDDRLRIVLTNPGVYRGPRPGSEGLPTVAKRLQLAYEGAARLHIGAAGAQTRVELELPLGKHG